MSYFYDILCRNFGGKFFEDLYNFAQLKIQISIILMATTTCVFQVNEEDIDFGNKLHCVDELANRWWYALPAWPPANYNYEAALARNGLRAIDVESFRAAPEIDPSTGAKKVYSIEHYEGIYRDL